MSITSDEVNFLVYRYLQESGKRATCLSTAESWAARGAQRPSVGGEARLAAKACSVEGDESRLGDRPVGVKGCVLSPGGGSDQRGLVGTETGAVVLEVALAAARWGSRARAWREL